MALSKGSVVVSSAPPTAAANVPTVTRIMLTQGSRVVRVRGEVTAWMEAAAAASPTPPVAATLAQSALSLARLKMRG